MSDKDKDDEPQKLQKEERPTIPEKAETWLELNSQNGPTIKEPK